MPLIDNHQVVEYDVSVEDIVEVVFTVAFDEELGSVEFGVAAVDCRLGQIRVTVICDLIFK